MQATQNELISPKAEDCLNRGSKEEATERILRPVPGQGGNAEPWQCFAPEVVLCASHNSSHLSLNWKTQASAVLHC